MNRIFAIFLLHVMMLIAIQPIATMHYCKGTLQSLRIFGSNDQKDCCNIPDNDAVNNSCCSAHMGDSTSENHYCDENQNSGCCDFQTIQVSTDDFQSENTNISYDKSTHSFEDIWVALVSHFKQETPYSNSSPLPDAFPADGLFLKDVSFLTYICTYRIWLFDFQ